MSTVLHMLHGVVKCSGRHTLELVVQLALEFLPSLGQLIKVYCGHDIAELIISLALTLTNNEVQFLEDKQQQVQLLGSVAQLVQQYCAAHQKQLQQLQAATAVDAPQASQQYGDDDKFTAISLLLELLTALSVKQMWLNPRGLVPPADSPASIVQQGVGGGLTMLLPFIRGGHVDRHHTMTTAYFALMEDVLGRCAALIFALDEHCVGALLECLVHGLQSHVSEVVRQAADCTAAVAQHCHVVLAAESKQQQQQHHPVVTSVAAELPKFLQLAFQLLLAEQSSRTVLNKLADCAFAVLVLLAQRDPSALDALGQQLVGAAKQDQRLQQAVATAFTSLLSDNGLQLNNTGRNRLKFRRNMTTFVVAVRGLLQTK